MPKDNARDGKLVLYHYTDSASAQKIKQSGVIKQSQPGGGDAAFGSGTYMTSLKPSVDKGTLAKNNYDDFKLPKQRQAEGKVDYGVAVHFRTSDPRVQKVDAGGRDVYKITGDVNLKDRKHAVFKKSDYERK